MNELLPDQQGCGGVVLLWSQLAARQSLCQHPSMQHRT